MKVDTKIIVKLREETGAGMMDAKKALEKSDGDYGRAIEYLRAHGQKVAAAKQERQTKDGFIGSYVHANGKVAALVALACESDFVANTADFQGLAHELAMQVVATDPAYLQPSDVPPEVVAKETDVFRQQLQLEGKPEKIWDKIVAGKLDKFYGTVCLLQQPYIKDDSKTVEQLVQELVLKLGENIQVRTFKRVTL